MPKGNPGRLKDRFEIRGELTPNEYEFQQHHGEMTEEEHENFPPADEGQGETPEALMSPQQREAARIAEVEARAHEIALRRRAKRAKSESKSARTGGTRKSTKKSAGKNRGAAKKGLAASKARSTGSAKKGAAKKGGAKKAAGKSAKAGAGKKAAKRR